jgi:hypothetical protein
MSTGETVWKHVNGLSEALDGSREGSERTLDELHARLRSLTVARRDEVRRQMILIVAGLARLEVRLVESDGPVQSAV